MGRGKQYEEEKEEERSDRNEEVGMFTRRKKRDRKGHPSGERGWVRQFVGFSIWLFEVGG